MLDPARITRMRRLLDQAAPSEPPRHVLGGIVHGPLRRRAMTKQIGLAAARYGLQLDVDAYLAAAGVASLAGLDTTQLERLAEWAAQEMDRQATACDSPYAPPAR